MIKPSSVTKRNIMDGIDKAFGIVNTPHQGRYCDRKLAKISPKIHKIEIWPKSRPKVINSPNQSHRDHIWGMFEL